MSDGHGEQHLQEEAAGSAEAPSAPATAIARRRPYGTALGLAALLIAVLAGVALSPFWVPQLAPLLPWGPKPAASADEYAALAARVAAIERHPPAPSVNIDALKSSVDELAQRLGQLETAVNSRLATSTTNVDATKSQLAGLTQRIDRLDAAGSGNRQLESSVAAAKAGLADLQQRLTAVEAQSSSRTDGEAANLQKLQQELSGLGTTTSGLADRVGALEQQSQSQGTAELRTDAMLALLLMQMREAVEQARPFPAEYSAFTTLAHDPGLKAAVEPLANAARNGVAGRAVLEKRLTELSTKFATATEPVDETDWGHKVLAHLRGLVTIRRIDGPSQTGPDAAVGAAQIVLARGDLSGAVAALDGLTGANAEAAGPWLKMARERLAVEAALNHLQELLTVRLGSAPPAPPVPPSGAPQDPPATRTPS